jgi:hypothetical protein
VELVHVGDLVGAQGRVVLHPAGLVPDVLLVEGGGPRKLDVLERVLVAGGRGGRLVGGLGAEPHQKGRSVAKKGGSAPAVRST